MLTVTDQRPAPAELSCLCAMYFTKIGIDANILEACLGQQESNLLRPSALSEMNLRQNFLMTRIHVLGPTWRKPSQGARNPATGDEITIDQQQLSTRNQNALPFCEGRSRIDEGPYKVAGYEHIETCIGQHGTLRVSLHKNCGRNFGAGALEHGLGPIETCYRITKIVAQAGNLSRSGRQIEQSAPRGRSEVFLDKRLPSCLFFTLPNLVAWLGVESGRSIRPVVADLIA